MSAPHSYGGDLDNLVHLLTAALEQAKALRAVSQPENGEVKKLRYALSLCSTYCEHLHHEKKHQHKAGEPCPVEKIINDALYATSGLARNE